jgi:hypothetical protein
VTLAHTQPEFMEAVRSRDVEAVGMWIELGYKVLGETLIEAVRSRSLEIVEVRGT